MVNAHQRRVGAFRTEQHEVQNVDFVYDAFEKSLSFCEAVPDGTSEFKHYAKIAHARFHSLQGMLVILACETENEDHVNVLIDQKR